MRYFTLITICILFSSTISIAGEFSIIPDDTNKEIVCKNFSVKSDGYASCSVNRDKTTYQYFLSNIIVNYNGIKIHPYKWDIDKIMTAIKSKDCDYIISSLYGPFYVGRELRAHLFMGWLYENGICNNINLPKALQIYKLLFSHDKSNKTLLKRIKELQLKTSTNDFFMFSVDSKPIECKNLNINSGIAKCDENNITLTDIEKIYFKKQTIYPYKNNWETEVQMALMDKDCDTLYKYLYGPAYIDNLKEANVYLAAMYEDGICKDKNIRKSMFYYKSAADKHRVIADGKIDKLTMIIKKEEEEKLRIKKQQEKLAKSRALDRMVKRIEYEEQKIKCTNECLIDKYKVDQDCFLACMKDYPEIVKVEQVETVKSGKKNKPSIHPPSGQ